MYSAFFECKSKPEFPPFRGLMVRVLRQWFRWYDLAHHSSCAWRMTCKCSSWFPYRLACSHCARCPQTRKEHLGVPINPMGALIAATIRGSNARRALTAMTVAPVILGTAKQRIEGSAADNRPGSCGRRRVNSTGPLPWAQVQGFPSVCTKLPDQNDQAHQLSRLRRISQSCFRYHPPKYSSCISKSILQSVWHFQFFDQLTIV